MKAAGSKTMAFTEFVDIYPTLVELCGIELPKHLEGTSMVPLLNDPQKPWKKAAFSQYPYKDKGMGYSMRTDRYRYTEWHEIADGKVLGCELYDHQQDPSENVNVADKPENKQLVADLSKELAAGYQAAKPKP
jgi:arylsulfatase A-like enzyme